LSGIYKSMTGCLVVILEESNLLLELNYSIVCVKNIMNMA